MENTMNLFNKNYECFQVISTFKLKWMKENLI